MCLSIATSVCFIACHGGPADHFATFAETLGKQGCQVEVFASGPAKQKFEERKLDLKMFPADGTTPEEEAKVIAWLAEKCQKFDCVITDVGHPFNIAMQKALKEKAPDVMRLAYYDNPEPFVPGGYSETAAKVMQEANKVLFANVNLARGGVLPENSVPTPVGIGYMAIDNALAIQEDRLSSTNGNSPRAEFLQNHGIQEGQQKILGYFGGNNEEYFQKAFPAFLNILQMSLSAEDLSNLIVVVQQHPGAKQSNKDLSLLNTWQKEGLKGEKAPLFVQWKGSSTDLLKFIDCALYYQTSMSPLFGIAGVPCMQIGHNTFEDVLVKNGFSPSVTSADQFLLGIKTLKSPKAQEILAHLGYDANWQQNLAKALEISCDYSCDVR